MRKLESIEKKKKLLVLFAEVCALIPSSASFATVGWIKDVVVLD